MVEPPDELVSGHFETSPVGIDDQEPLTRVRDEKDVRAPEHDLDRWTGKLRGAL